MAKVPRAKERKKKKAKEPRVVTLRARRSVMIPLLAASIAGVGILILLGLREGALNAALMAALLFAINGAYVWLAIATPVVAEIGEEAVLITRGNKTIYEGPYFAISKTFMPASGVGFAVPPLSMGVTLSLAFSHPFLISASRNRIAFPGVFVAGVKELLAPS